MKARTHLRRSEAEARADLEALATVLAKLRDAGEVRDFLLDLCTPAELEAMSDRWKVVPWLLRGVPYREIHAQTAVSVATVGRVARCLEQGSGGYRHAVRRLRLPQAAQDRKSA